MLEKFMMAFFAPEKIERFKFMLEHELGISFARAKSIATIVASLFSLAVTFAVFLAQGEIFLMLLAFFSAFACAYFLTLIFLGFLAERSLITKEKSCAEALMHASLMPEGTTVEAIISYLAKGNHAIAKEFEIAEAEIKKGADTSTALSNIEKRCQGREISTVVQLLRMAETSGNIKPAMFRDAANELLEVRALLRERTALLTIQKMTLLLSSMFLVPLILGLLCGITKNFDLSYLDVLGLNKTSQKELVGVAAVASNFYVVELAAIASIFLGTQENNAKKAAMYFAIIAPVAFVIFSYASSVKL